jgi:hypothetical protein
MIEDARAMPHKGHRSNLRDYVRPSGEQRHGGSECTACAQFSGLSVSAAGDWDSLGL